MGKEKECRFGHVCTSGCGNDFDCPCQSEHCCAFTEDCDGTCDDCFNKDSEESRQLTEDKRREEAEQMERDDMPDMGDMVNDNLNER